MINRRAFLSFSVCSGAAQALGRTPVGGTLRFALPLRIAGLDPHALDDPLSALFAAAVADPLYALDATGVPYPALAQSLPRAFGDRTSVTLRSGLTSARGKKLSARDAVFSLERARRRAAAGVLSAFGPPKADPADGLTLLFPPCQPEALARALASPVTALVPRGFSPLAPDGTGAFRAELGQGSLTLLQNPSAARGASFLERIAVERASDLADGLRAFESERADFGWLGSGLHRARPGAIAFSGPEYGWAILRTGREAKSWGAPGVAQSLLDGLPAGRLAHLGVVAAAAARTGTAWGGGAAVLHASSESPQLLAMAEAIAPLISRPGHPVSAAGISEAELAERRAGGRFTLLLDFVRRIGPPGPATLYSLLAAESVALAARPPDAASYAPADIARRLSLGVVGALGIKGARLPEYQALESWQLGGAFRRASAA